MLVTKMPAETCCTFLQVINITSKGDVPWRMLSPFFPHGGIPIPGAAPGCMAKSVEGIWQGLKVFPDGTGIDQRKFSNGTMQNLKRCPWTKEEGRKHKLQVTLAVFLIGMLSVQSHVLPCLDSNNGLLCIVHRGRIVLLVESTHFANLLISSVLLTAFGSLVGQF